MHAWAEVHRLLWNSKSVLTDFLSRCMQYWLKNHWPDQALFKHSLHTNCNSNSAILHNNYISLLSDLCGYVHVKKKRHCKGNHSSSVSGSNHLVRLQTCKRSEGLVHCSVENAAVLCESHPYLVSLLFADLLSLYFVTFLMFFFFFAFNLVYFSTRCMLELKFAITEQQVCSHRFPQ